MQIENQESFGGSDAYSLFLYAVRSKVTRAYYLRRLRTFFNHINLLPNGTMGERCNFFATNGIRDPSWAFHSIIRFLQFERQRVESEQITGATLRNSVKAIKLFCEMADVPVAWKKITRGLPKSRRFADDRAPTLDELQRICDYPDRRIKAIVCTMSSSGIRLGAWDYLRWRDIVPIKRDGKIIAAKIVVYAGDEEEYLSFVTPEAYFQLEKWMEYRKGSGEKIDEKSWVMRQLWNTRRPLSSWKDKREYQAKILRNQKTARRCTMESGIEKEIQLEEKQVFPLLITNQQSMKSWMITLRLFNC